MIAQLEYVHLCSEGVQRGALCIEARRQSATRGPVGVRIARCEVRWGLN